MDQKLIHVTLLVQLGVAAAVSSALGRSRLFQSLLFKENRSLRETVYLVLFICVPLGLGVWVRATVPNFLAADISFEAALLTGVVAGRFAGVLGGALLSIPGMFHGEFFTLPFYLTIGYMAGSVREMANREDVWTFSPFVDLSIWRWIRRNIPRPTRDWQIALFCMVIALQFVAIQLTRLFPGKLFALYSPYPVTFIAIHVAAVVVIGIFLKIWNNTRNEIKLEEQQRLLLLSRMEALQNQINPHFLFNTLNSIQSLVRLDPDKARTVIVKLASILRRLLQKSDAFVPFADEMQFLDDYLSIEQVRFGSKLRVVKDLEPETLDLFVPSMLIQPLVENSIKHGISEQINGGTITIRSYTAHDRLVVQVEDDGVGIAPTGCAHNGNSASGIGMQNVSERLKVLFEDAGRMIVISSEGKGTLVSLEVPLVTSGSARAGGSGLLSARPTSMR